MPGSGSHFSLFRGPWKNRPPARSLHGLPVITAPGWGSHSVVTWDDVRETPARPQGAGNPGRRPINVHYFNKRAQKYPRPAKFLSSNYSSKNTFKSSSQLCLECAVSLTAVSK